MLHWSVGAFANIPEHDVFGTGGGNRKSNRIPIAVNRKVRTRRIAQVAEFANGSIGRGSFLAGGATGAVPTGTQRQAHRMRP